MHSSCSASSPGPSCSATIRDVAGGIFIAYLSGNLVLLVAGVVLAPFFGAVLRLRKAWLLPAILLLSVMGTYSLQNSTFDLWIMLFFGVIGYLLRRAEFPLAPIIIGLILGPILESNLRRSLLISRDGLAIFVERPIAATNPHGLGDVAGLDRLVGPAAGADPARTPHRR